MKILHELNQLEKGGAERVVESIIKYDKVNTHVVYAYKDGPMKSVLENAGAQVLIQSDDVIDMECDVVHIHTGGNESLMASCVKNQLPTIETVHSPVVSKVRDEWVQVRVGVSDQVTKLNRKCKTIYNGIDFERLELRPKKELFTKTLREELGIPKNAFVVGRLGRIAYDKCLVEWLAAAKKFQDSGLCPNAHFLIVGDEASSSKGLLAKVKVMAASLPLKNIHFVPAVEEVGYAYEAMDLFMYPSPTEGFGLVYMEAMACGVPCLLWDNPLTKELTLGAAFLSKNTVKDLAENLIYLALNPDIRNEIGIQGQKTVLNGFTAQIMSEAYTELYQSLKGSEINA